jgi:predicted aspartyl protease
MPEYDAENFDPPAPVAYALLRNPATGSALQNVPMLIDTGADATAIPSEYAEQLGIEPVQNKAYVVESFDGQSRISPVIEAELEILGRKFKGQFLLVEQPHDYLGRNVLISSAFFWTVRARDGASRNRT